MELNIQEQVVMPLVGGGLIGLAAAIVLLFLGRILGASGVVGGILKMDLKDMSWRVAIVSGLLIGGLALKSFELPVFQDAMPRPNWALVIAGFLVGYGSRLGSGCTSGHGVCGISRFSIRSIVATLTFIATGVVTVTLYRIMAGG